jgi:hypothetical protein
MALHSATVWFVALRTSSVGMVSRISHRVMLPTKVASNNGFLGVFEIV